MRDVTDDNFRAALSNADNARIIANVCGRYRGRVPDEELKYRGYMALFHCMRKHDPSRGNKFTSSLHRHAVWQCRKALAQCRNDKAYCSLPIVRAAASPSERIDVRDCMDLLERGDRDILFMYYFASMTLEEIGRENDYSCFTAQRKLRLAESRFGRLYRGFGV